MQSKSVTSNWATDTKKSLLKLKSRCDIARSLFDDSNDMEEPKREKNLQFQSNAQMIAHKSWDHCHEKLQYHNFTVVPVVQMPIAEHEERWTERNSVAM